MSESSRSKCRVSPREVKLETTDQGLTSYAGLLPVIRFVQKRLRFRELCSETVAHERGANAALFQCAILAYNLVRWMALLSGDEQLRRWEMQTVRTFLIRVAGKLARGSRQLTLKTPKEHLHARFRSRQDTAAKHRFGSRPPSRRFPDPVAPPPAAVLRARETRIAGFGCHTLRRRPPDTPSARLPARA